MDGLLREEEEVCCGGAEGAAMGKWAGRGQTAGQGWPTGVHPGHDKLEF